MRMNRGKNNRYRIYLSLIHKYDNQVNYFHGTSLELIIQNKASSSVIREFMEVNYWCEEKEFMKRMYRCVLQDNTREIDQRIRWLGKFYLRNPGFVTFEYPTMYVTHTQKIFFIRLKRIYKARRADSADTESENDTSQIDITFTQLLERINQTVQSGQSSSAFGSMFAGSLFAKGESEKSFETDPHNVYDQSQKGLEHSDQIPISFLRTVQIPSDNEQMQKIEDSVNLVCDFEDLDEDAIEKYLKKKKREYRNRERSRRDNSSNIIIESIQQQKKQEPHHLEEEEDNLKEDKETYLKNRQNYLRDHYVRRYGLNHFLNNGITIREPRYRNKGQIKEKAKALLQRINSPEYLPHCQNQNSQS